MHLISTGRTTVLSDFANLNSKSVYKHINDEATDFQFYSSQRIFVEVNKKSGLEILRVKDKQNQNATDLEIQRVRKLTVKNVCSVACAKQSVEDMAFGLANGEIKVFNYKNSEYVHRFKADTYRKSVLYLDYNASDEYLAGVFESGQTNIYGMKTKAKIESIQIDGNSTLARFHPVKRFHLAIASFKGAVTTYDVQAKRKIFNVSDGHKAPCRDVAMSAAKPDTLISAGYDCIVNIFDTRKKTSPLRIVQNHPLSAVALSECGTYMCVGNLKGELATFDLRNLKSNLVIKKIHESVTRIAFLPNNSENNTTSFNTNSSQSPVAAEEAQLERDGSVGVVRPSTAANGRDSFYDVFDAQTNKGYDRVSTRFALKHDSYEWELSPRNRYNESNAGGILPTGSGLNDTDNKSYANILTNSFENKPTAVEASSKSARALRDRSNLSIVGKLKHIQEEQLSTHVDHLDTNLSGSDKENPPAELELGSRLSILPGDRNSTPNIRSSMNDNQTTSVTGPIAQVQPNAGHSNSDVKTLINDLRVEMMQRLQQLEAELKFNAETNKFHLITQMFNMWTQQTDSSEEILRFLGLLLHNDSFVAEFISLKEENLKLKEQLKKM